MDGTVTAIKTLPDGVLAEINGKNNVLLTDSLATVARDQVAVGHRVKCYGDLVRAG